MYDDLTRLAIVHGADKFGYHDYTPNYFKLLHARRDEPLKLLEIGVGGYGDEDRGGYSLRMWRDFFPRAQIVGIDLHAKTLDLGQRITVLKGSQVDADFLATVVRDHGPFDVIVDDGSHFNEHVVRSYEILFPTLRDGGIYIAEDLQTAFRPNRGGSLALDPPNSLGFFSAIQARIGADATDPSVHSVVAMERFHNIVAVHKASAETPTSRVIGSNRIDAVSGPMGGPARILFVGRAASPDPESWTAPWSGRFRTALETHLDPAQPEAAEITDEHDRFDLIVCRLPGTGASEACDIDRLFGRLDQNGVLVCLTEEVDRRELSPSSRLMTQVHSLFVEIDHAELLANFPDASVGPLARQLQSMEMHGDGFLLFKADNTYPSNFAFNFTHRRVREALDRIDAVLAQEWTEDGLLHAAQLMRRAKRREISRSYMDRIWQGPVTRRWSFLLAADMARETGDAERLDRAIARGFEAFPSEPRFALEMAERNQRQGDLAAAERVLRRGIENAPRARQLHAALTRLLRDQERWSEAVDANRLSIRFHPRADRPALSLMQVDMLLHLDRPEAAMREVLRSIADVDTHAPSYAILSALEARRGNSEAAAAAIEKALELDPANAEYRARRDSLRGLVDQGPAKARRASAKPRRR